MSGALAGILGGLLRHQGGDMNLMHGMIDNLARCDVKREGLCCYFPGICDPLARCISEPSPSNVFELGQSIPKCLCPEGFEGDGRTKGSGCMNVDECATGLAQCEQMCTDLIPGYRCECRSGFRLNQDGRTCRDINECLERKHNCSQTCTNTHGGYKCGCRKGYRLDPLDLSTCLEIDECEEALITGVSVCQFDSLCVNLPGTYQCGCPPGMEPSESDPRQCLDRNECLTMEEPCPTSHVHIDGREMESQMCENLIGGWSCVCLPGSRLRKEVEVLSPITERDALMFSAEDMTWRFERAQRLAGQVQCDDIDECEETPGLCLPSAEDDGGIMAVCENSFRGFTCVCPVEGLLYDRESRRCVDVDECALGLCGADPLMECVNLEPGYECKCKAGYEERDFRGAGPICVDINECLQEEASCPPGSVCRNQPGTYDCVCESGYEAIYHERVDGSKALFKCLDIDECAVGLCPGPCMNIPGSFYCGCPRGTGAVNHTLPQSQEQWREIVTQAALASSWTSKTFEAFISTLVECEDLDECSLTNGKICGDGCSCVNLPGTYECDQKERIQRTYLDDEPRELMRITEGISQNLADLPLLAVLPHIRLDELLPALHGLQSGSPVWHFTHLDWRKSGGLSVKEMPQQIFAASSHQDALEALVETLGDMLLQSAQVTCRPNKTCFNRQASVCTKVSAPCCRDLENGAFECLPATFRLSSRRHVCPLDTVDRLTG